jgi:hypothetical protein
MLTPEDSKRVADEMIAAIRQLDIYQAIKFGIAQAFDARDPFAPSLPVIIERAIQQGIENGMKR